MLAIHHRTESFSDKWLEYCEMHGIPCRLVDCYSSDVLNQTKDCWGLMWHWSHSDPAAAQFARQLIASVELSGKLVFPNTNTCWHFDDKVGQKYLLEAIGAPLVPSYASYDKREACAWAEQAAYPKVFKLRGGAGAENVVLVKSFSQARRLIGKAFGRGVPAKSRRHYLRERLWHFRRQRDVRSLLNIGKGVARLFIPTEVEKKSAPQRQYVYFQDFISGLDHDIRVIVIGARAFAIKRKVRRGDFRASGSGDIVYDPSEIPVECVNLAFSLSEKIGAQCLAYDFLCTGNTIYLVEISYSFSRKVYLPCPGFWDRECRWHDGHFVPEWFMMEDLLQQRTLRPES